MDAPRASAPPRRDAVISEERFERYHAYAREHGVSLLLYILVRAIITPACLIWFRLERHGRRHARVDGGLIVASNHRSFLDPFVIALLLPWRRRIQFVAKVELFERRWPTIELQWGWLGGLPPLRKAAVVGAGSWGTAIAVLLARGGLEVQLGTRSTEKAAELARKRLNDAYLPGVELPEQITVKRTAEIELGACDLVCLAVPSAALPAVVGSLAERIGSRAAVLMLSKGLVQPLGMQ